MLVEGRIPIGLAMETTMTDMKENLGITMTSPTSDQQVTMLITTETPHEHHNRLHDVTNDQ